MTEKTDQHNESRESEVKPDVASQAVTLKPGRQHFWLCCSMCGSMALHMLFAYIFAISFAMMPMLVIAPEPGKFWLSSFFFTAEDIDNSSSATPPELKTATLSSKSNSITPTKKSPAPLLPEPPKASEPSPVVEAEVFVTKALPVAVQSAQRPAIPDLPADEEMAAKLEALSEPEKQEVVKLPKEPPQYEPPFKPVPQTALHKAYSSAKIAPAAVPKLSEKLLDRQPEPPPIEQPKLPSKAYSPPVPQPAVKPLKPVRVEQAVGSEPLDADRLARERLEQERAAIKARLELEKKEMERQTEAKALREKLAREEKAAIEEREQQAKLKAELEMAAAAKAAKERENRELEQQFAEKARRELLDRKEKATREERAREAEARALQEKLALDEKAAKEEKERQAKAKALREKLEREEMSAIEERERQVKLKAERERDAAIKAARELESRRLEQQAAEKARREHLEKEEKAAKEEKKRLAEAKALREKREREEETIKVEMDRQARLNAERERERAVKQAKEEYEKALKAISQRQEKPKGLLVPTIKGDMKLVVAGQAPHKIMISFREFKAYRRPRPFSQAELKQYEQITPISVSTGEQKFEFVIEKAREGVYTLMLEQAPEKPATFSLLLYEGTGRAVKKELGSRVAGQKRMSVKILMPEGILWDDEAAFTGSMEDSETETKFNSDSGLVWKELKED